MGRIPHFKSEEDEAKFWGEHSTADYLEDTEPADEVEVAQSLKQRIEERARQKRPVTLRLELGQIEAAKAIARKKGLSYQTLIRMWVVEDIQRETRTNPLPRSISQLISVALGDVTWTSRARATAAARTTASCTGPAIGGVPAGCAGIAGHVWGICTAAGAVE